MRNNVGMIQIKNTEFGNVCSPFFWHSGSFKEDNVLGLAGVPYKKKLLMSVLIWMFVPWSIFSTQILQLSLRDLSLIFIWMTDTKKSIIRQNFIILLSDTQIQADNLSSPKKLCQRESEELRRAPWSPKMTTTELKLPVRKLLSFTPPPSSNSPKKMIGRNDKYENQKKLTSSSTLRTQEILHLHQKYIRQSKLHLKLLLDYCFLCFNIIMHLFLWKCFSQDNGMEWTNCYRTNWHNFSNMFIIYITQWLWHPGYIFIKAKIFYFVCNNFIEYLIGFEGIITFIRNN